jgi:L-malate glycosyltransferase
MRILLFAEPSSSHVVKWANSLSDRGIKVAIFGLSHTYDKKIFDKSIIIKNIDIFKFIKSKRDGNLLKSSYLIALPKILQLIRKFSPDILHAHSASSYGFLGALTGFHPYYLSIWGSDVYLFPKKSIFHKNIFKFTLNRADRIFTTSQDMKEATSKYSSKNINVLPFGVDTSYFKPTEDFVSYEKKDLLIGAIKALDYNYGIEYLIYAFNRIVKKYPSLQLKLLLVGDGSQSDSLRDLVKRLEIIEKVIFTGRIEFKEIVKYHNMLDIAIVPSVSEGFGVSVLESSACEKPVIASDIGGLKEVVENGVTGYFFKSRNVDDLESNIEKLVFDSALRIKLGKAGREMVKRKFEWSKCVDRMVDYYKEKLILH